MSKSPENISNSPGHCCYGYWKVTKWTPNSMKSVHFSVYHRADTAPRGVLDVIVQLLVHILNSTDVAK